MGHIAVELRDELCSESEPSEVLDANVDPVLPGFDDRRYPLLRLIDKYGDTVFSAFQMSGLLDELHLRFAETGDATVPRLIDIAERCSRRPRTWLVFVGD